MTPAEIATLATRLDGIHADVQEIKTELAPRVRDLELWRASLTGAGRALHWIPMLLLGIAVGVAVGVLGG